MIPYKQFEDIPLIPAPASGQLLPGSFVLGKRTPLEAPLELVEYRPHLASALSGLPHAASAGGVIRLRLSQPDSAVAHSDDESYALDIQPGEVLLEAPSEAGIFRGIQTLLQIIQAHNLPGQPCSLPCLTIKDQPSYGWRGLMLDSSRHFWQVQEVKNFLDHMAYLKFNRLHWHLTDDQGWRIEIKAYPELTRTGAMRRSSPLPGAPGHQDGTPYGPWFYTQDQIREIIDYASQRHIEIIPEIDLPGHVVAALACYPELGCTGGPYEVRTTWGIEDHVLCLGNPEALRFSLKVLAEAVSLLPGSYIHIGGDEVPENRWQECPRCLEAARKAGLAGVSGLRQAYTHALEDFLQSHGKRAIGWDEILDQSPRTDTIIASWRGTESGIRAAALGNDVVMCPHTHCYLDYRFTTDIPVNQGPGAPHDHIITLEKCYHYDPAASITDPAVRRHIIGLQGNLWSEYIWTEEDLHTMAFPRAHALAEVGWSPASRKDFAAFQRRLHDMQHCRLPAHPESLLSLC